MIWKNIWILISILFWAGLRVDNLTAATPQETRIKDILTIKGVRSNPLIGYGLVIGLNGSGDSSSEVTLNSLKRFLSKMGLDPKTVTASKNVAAVIVTATLPPFARSGQKLDVTISSIGDAASLAGGTLLVTPLRGGDGETYAVANGSLSIGGLNKGKAFATTAKITNGATVEKEIKLEFDQKKSLRLALNIPDFTTAYRVENVINTNLGGKFATARDSTTIDLIIPYHYNRNVVELVALVENFRVITDSKAKIVINERTGTVVAGGEVLLKEVAISHGDLTIEVGGKKDAKSESVIHIDQSANLNDLVKSLNALGVTPEDLISIFGALKANGSLIGEIEFI